MFLDYFALLMLFLSITAIVYLFIYIHDLPYRAAKERNHPNQEAIHYACWLSLFTLHAIWPFIYIWAVVKKHPYPIEIVSKGTSSEIDSTELAQMTATLEKLQARVKELEQTLKNRGPHA